MAIHGSTYWSPFEQLKAHYETTELKCPACGYLDVDGSWEADTSGRQVNYRHECPSCGSVRRHTIQTDRGR